MNPLMVFGGKKQPRSPIAGAPDKKELENGILLPLFPLDFPLLRKKEHQRKKSSKHAGSDHGHQRRHPRPGDPTSEYR
jgi:hypothetical protein